MKQKNRLISITLATLMLVSLCAVYISTSVSAEPQPTPPGKPIAAGTGPSGCVLQGTKLWYVFVKGYDGALWYNIYNTGSAEKAPNWGNSGWYSLGGKLDGSPVALSRSPGIITVYVTGTNGAIYEKSTVDYGKTWQGFYRIGGTAKAGTGPASSGWTGHEDIFVTGTNGALYQKTWTATSGWTNWANLGGQLTSSPAATSQGAWGQGRIDVSARGTNGALYHKWYTGTWSGWENLGGAMKAGTGPALSSCHGYEIYRIDAFVIGTDGAMWQKTWKATSGWSSWVRVGGMVSGSLGAMSWDAYIYVYARGWNGGLYSKEWFSGKWWPWSGGMVGPPCVYNCPHSLYMDQPF